MRQTDPSPYSDRRAAVRSSLPLVVALLVTQGPTPSASAQTDEVIAPSGPGLVICPPELRVLGRRVVRTLSMRGHTAELSVVSSDALPEVYGAGTLTIWPLGSDLEVRLIGPAGRDRVATLRRPEPGSPAGARVVALAAEALADQPLPPPAPTGEPGEPTLALHYPQRAPGGAEFRRGRPRALATPTVILRFMLGYTPLTGQPLVGPGAGLGVCTRGHCLLLEAGLSLVPSDREVGGERFRFRYVDTGLRLLFRLVQRGRFGAAYGLGLLSRVGEAFALDRGQRRVVSDLGVRTTLETSVRLAGPFELVLEGGLDAAISRATYLRAGQRVFLEDRLRPWVTLGFRLRPDPESDRSEDRLEN